ncbi:formyltetrahydrofolate deformylase [Ancylobacter dichloromethanicus]|uniref:Formyltetrahydrofolate deformylase n=2 Tax=Ancylobacter dichloromethanicus TaxID=518825 RepID=A0A9W6JDJ7_9HYPH|nr:formyltetrahydrofolate deformylase [Ancylobacter dichloromethanicus]
MRTSFNRGDNPSLSMEEVRDAFSDVASKYEMKWSLRQEDATRSVIILVSRFDHCLVDLLYRRRIGELPMSVAAIISNHPMESFSELDIQNVPFYYLPVNAETKQSQEARVRELIDGSGAELVILARYMQILSQEFSAHLSGRCINIHHSFLPGFKGARPYHQAHRRGVKLIGATAHYVTDALDEGPIIEQDVERITHGDTPDSLIRKGRDIERRVLAKAVRYHLEDRVFMHGATTIVFPD